MVNLSGLMVKDILAIGHKENKMGLELCLLIMEIINMENGNRVKELNGLIKIKMLKLLIHFDMMKNNM